MVTATGISYRPIACGSPALRLKIGSGSRPPHFDTLSLSTLLANTLILTVPRPNGGPPIRGSRPYIAAEWSLGRMELVGVPLETLPIKSKSPRWVQHDFMSLELLLGLHHDLLPKKKCIAFDETFWNNIPAMIQQASHNQH